MDIIAVQTTFAFEASAAYVGHPVTPDEGSAITWEMIERGRTIAGTAHTRDVDSLRLLGREIAASLAPYDVFVTPTMPQPPRPLGYWDMSKPGLDAYDANLPWLTSRERMAIVCKASLYTGTRSNPAPIRSTVLRYWTNWWS